MSLEPPSSLMADPMLSGLGRAGPHQPPSKWFGRYGALLPLFRPVGALCIAALWRVKSLLRRRSDRPKLTDRSFDLEIHRTCFAAVLFDLGHWGYRRLLNHLSFSVGASHRAP